MKQQAKANRPAVTAGHPRPMSSARAVLETNPPKKLPDLSVHHRWNWHYRTLLTLRERLLSQRSERLQEAAAPLEQHSLSEADSATDEFDHNLALAKTSAERDMLYEVEEALDRIRNGTYGICEETGRPISPARLRAVPWTRFSRQVERNLERDGALPRPHMENPLPIHKTVSAEAPIEQSAEGGDEVRAADELVERTRRVR